MKVNKYIGLSALIFSLAACQEDALVDKQSQEIPGVYTLKAVMDNGINDSRAQILLGNSSTEAEYFYWNKDDQFTVVQYYNDAESNDVYKQHTFSIDKKYDDALAPTVTADFTAVGFEEQTNGSLTAFYPAVDEIPNLGAIYGVECTLDMEMHDNSNKSIAAYFKKNMFMTSTHTVNGEDINLKFSHLCGLVRVTYTNSTNSPKSIKSVELGGSEWTKTIFVNSGGVIDKQVGERPANVTKYGIVFDNEVIVEPTKSEDFYILFFEPQNRINNDEFPLRGINITYSDGTTTSSPTLFNGRELATMMNGSFEAGHRYWLNLTDTDAGLAWSNQTRFSVSTFEELQGALAVMTDKNTRYEIELRNDIYLKKPLAINGDVRIYFNDNSLLCDPNYMNPDKIPAMITNNGILTLKGGATIQGPVGANDHQYLIYSNGTNLSCSDIQFNSGGIPNGLYLCNGRNSFGRKTGVNAENGIAFYLDRTTDYKYLTFVLDTRGEILGDIQLNVDETLSSPTNIEIELLNAKGKGNFEINENLKEYVIIGTEWAMEGNGWTEFEEIDLLPQLLDNFSKNMVSNIEILNLSKDITFIVPSDAKERVLRIGELSGQGNITFKYEGISQIPIDFTCEETWPEGVNIAYEGNIQKIITVKTTDIEYFFNLCTQNDRLNLSLADNVELTKSITLNDNMVWMAESNYVNGVRPAINLNLNGCELSASPELTEPAIKMTSGLFYIHDDSMYPSGTFKAPNGAFLLGSSAVENNNTIEVRIKEKTKVTSSNGSCFTFAGPTETEAFKNIVITNYGTLEGKDSNSIFSYGNG